ncbi:ribonuclease YeeF family protein [Sporolactobacillus sp. THM19-2]|uniref:ribonuclease YeeF family protein n=1 Tax=Sporolactobacillus sp. THM19-2 TaxID=2511171 RepID=UPI001021FC64|nr:LXG domain-containing protein [Sporolactobacillus sp. THM19-2]RYL87089.1 hypothetical protein EWH91_13435 [Sporolactobacillus sp. THM19-2]
MRVNMGSGSAGETQTYDAEALIAAAEARARRYQTLRDQFHSLRTAFQQIAGLGSDFQGKGADAIKEFYAAQVTVADSWLRLIDKKIAYFQGVAGTIEDKHLGGDTKIHVPFLNEDLSIGHARSKEMVREQREDIARILSSISDLVPIHVFSNHDVDQALDAADKKRAQTALDVQDLDQSLTSEYRQISEDLPHIQTLYEALIHATHQGADVQPMHFNATTYYDSKAYQLEENRTKETYLYLNYKAQQKAKYHRLRGKTAFPADRPAAKKLKPKLRLYVNKAIEDHKKGKISKKTLDSILSGILNTGTAFIQNSIETKLTNKVSKQIASSVITWIQKNTTHFVDRGLVGATITGGTTTIREAPALLSSAIRTGAIYGVPVVGSAIDFTVQLYRGEDTKDAAIKTGGHVGAGMVGAAIGSAIPIPIFGSAAGFAIGVTASMAFDWLYDHKDDIAHQLKKLSEDAAHIKKKVVHSIMDNGKEVGEAVSGFFGNLGSAFN